MKSRLKAEAISLRRNGLSYSKILRRIPVAKSTLSEWLHSVHLSKKQHQRLTEKKLASAGRGAMRQHEKRMELLAKIKHEAVGEFKRRKSNSLWLVGIALYWAEGSKEKEHQPGSGADFNNSDPRMIRLFKKWLLEIMVIPLDELQYEIYIHETGDVKRALSFWSRVLHCQSRVIRVYFKRSKLKTNRKNTGKNYHGVMRISVRRSSVLNRRIAAWTDEMCKYWGVV